MSSRRRTLALLLGMLAIVAVLTVPVSLGPTITRRLTDALGERFGGEVEVKSIAVSVLPRPRVFGRGLVLRRDGRTDVPPLITLSSFSADAGIFGLLRPTQHLSRVVLEGLEINIPPGGVDDDEGEGHGGGPPHRSGPSPIVIEALVSKRATLRILRSKPGKPPRVWEIADLAMERVGAERPWPFRASLTNPVPPGNIEVEGTFGPWRTDIPGQTPLQASYLFEHADLGVFDGIQGILSSEGTFGGVLERIDARGQVSVPDFALSDVRHAVPLEARYHSIIDGTNGDTRLEPVDARFLNTRIRASGGIIDREGNDGRTVSLDIAMDAARLEDLLHLAAKGARPAMNGSLRVRASFVLPTGYREDLRALRLDGTFEVTDATFNDPDAREKVNALSAKARGVAKPSTSAAAVRSDVKGRFSVRRGIVRLSNVSYVMPGARVDVQGQYTLETGALDFKGTVRLAAGLSKMTSGIKAGILKLFDGLFRHDDVTVLPIQIGGTAEHPKVSLDVGRVLTGG